MIQLLNNIYINFNWINLIYFIATIIEDYLFLLIILIVFDVKSTKTQKSVYILCIITVSNLSSYFIPSPFNVITNYAITTILISFIFRINILKSFTAFVITTFAFGLLNILIQKPYLVALGISFDTFSTTAIYRIPYLLILYCVLTFIIIFLEKFNTIKLKLELLDSLDLKSKIILLFNIFLGVIILIVQMLTLDYYIDILPIIITILNFIFLISFLFLSIYSFTHMVELITTKRNLESSKYYNKSLQILYDTVSGFHHDFNTIISFIDGYLEDSDIDGLKKYFTDIKKEYKIASNLSLLNPNIINNPGIYSLLNNAYFRATKAGINFEIEIFLNLNNLNINLYIFSRILGIFLDNAIEESEKCNKKIIKISFLRENIYNRSVISIKNTYSNKNVDIEKIFRKGKSGKGKHLGIGLWKVKQYVKKINNLELNTSKDNDFFKQELFIYDL
mgnify:CR=1 FL=1